MRSYLVLIDLLVYAFVVSESYRAWGEFGNGQIVAGSLSALVSIVVLVMLHRAQRDAEAK